MSYAIEIDLVDGGIFPFLLDEFDDASIEQAVQTAKDNGFEPLISEKTGFPSFAIFDENGEEVGGG